MIWETYFDGGEPNDKWGEAMLDLSKRLTIEEIRSDGVTVNLSEVIRNKIEALSKNRLIYQM